MFRVAEQALIVRELVQSARRRHLYLLRMALPAIATAVLLLAVAASGTDWRTLSLATRPVYHLTAWMLLIVCTVLAGTYAALTIRLEWLRKTMPTLCITPMTHAGIVYGKLAGALGRVLMVAVGLLPVAGIWLNFSRLPKETVLATAGVIAASVLLHAALCMMEAAASLPKAGSAKGSFGYLAILYVIVTVTGGIAPWFGQPYCRAAQPFWSLYYVAQRTAPDRSLTAMEFAGAAIAIPVAVALPCLLLTPLFFRRTCRKAFGDISRSRRRVRRSRRRKRAPLRPGADPFFWQERRHTLLLAVAPWLILIAVLAAMIGVAMYNRDARFLRTSETFLALTIMVASIIFLAGTFHCTACFAREKARGTAVGLVLTGAPPKRLFRAKLKAVFLALSPSYALLAALMGLTWSLWPQGDSMAPLFYVSTLSLTTATLGVWAGAATALVFSAAAESPQKASSAMILSPILIGFLASLVFVCAFVPFARAAGAIIGAVAFARVNRRWTAWRVGVVFGLLVIGVSEGIAWLAMFTVVWMEGALPAQALTLLLAVGLTLGWARGWERFGCRIFDTAMLEEPVTTHRVARARPLAGPLEAVRTSRKRSPDDTPPAPPEPMP